MLVVRKDPPVLTKALGRGGKGAGEYTIRSGAQRTANALTGRSLERDRDAAPGAPRGVAGGARGGRAGARPRAAGAGGRPGGRRLGHGRLRGGGGGAAGR